MTADTRAQSALPSKLFFRIGEVASLVGVEPHVLRYWEREFRSIRPTKSAKGQRVYSRKDVENLLRVRDLLYRDGFTIAGAKKRLQRGGAETEATTAPASSGAPQMRMFDDPRGERELDVEERHDQEEEEEAETLTLSAEEPASGPRSHASHTHGPRATNPSVRVKLTALRAEVEAFLDELEGDHGERV